MIFYLAYAMGLLPLVWLIGRLWLKGHEAADHFWWLALAYAVSFVADSATLAGVKWVPSIVYPISQAGIIGAVLLDRDKALLFVTVLIGAGVLAVATNGVQGPDVLLRTVAWLGVAGIAYQYRAVGRLRSALLVSFGLGWVMWMGYVVAPGWTTWLAYQGVRALGLALFCYAAYSPKAAFKLARASYPERRYV